MMLGLKTHQEIDLRLCRIEESAEANRKMNKTAPETYIFNFEKKFLRGFGHEGECIAGTWIVIPGQVVSYQARRYVSFILAPLHWLSANTEMHCIVLPGQPDGKTMSLSLAPFAHICDIHAWWVVDYFLLYLGNWLLNGRLIPFWHQCVFSNLPRKIVASRDIALFHWIDLLLN